MSWIKLKRVLEEGMSVVQEQEKAERVAPLAAMQAAAEAFVAEVERRVGADAPLDLDLTEAFKGLVIEAAKRRWSPEDKDGVKKAFLLLGKDGTVKSRNHLATYEREAEKVRALLAALAPEVAAPAPPLPAAPEAKAA